MREPDAPLPRRGELWWANLGPRHGRAQAFRRPVLVLQSDDYTLAGLATVVVIPLDDDPGRAGPPARHLVPRSDENGLPGDSVALCDHLRALDGGFLEARIGSLEPDHLARVEAIVFQLIGLPAEE